MPLPRATQPSCLQRKSGKPGKAAASRASLEAGPQQHTQPSPPSEEFAPRLEDCSVPAVEDSALNMSNLSSDVLPTAASTTTGASRPQSQVNGHEQAPTEPPAEAERMHPLLAQVGLLVAALGFRGVGAQLQRRLRSLAAACKTRLPGHARHALRSCACRRLACSKC